jgi:hypothetical protein
MALKTVREDLRNRTLSAVAGLLGKLAYLSNLRRQDGSYSHWGLSRVHGEEPAQRALGEAHKSALSAVLRTPLNQLQDEIEETSRQKQVPEQKVLDELQEREALLLPAKPGAGSRRHLSSVLQALSALVKSRR